MIHRLLFKGVVVGAVVVDLVAELKEVQLVLEAAAVVVVVVVVVRRQVEMPSTQSGPPLPDLVRRFRMRISVLLTYHYFVSTNFV